MRIGARIHTVHANQNESVLVRQRVRVSRARAGNISRGPALTPWSATGVPKVADGAATD